MVDMNELSQCDEDLDYLDKRIDKLTKRFNKLEDLIYKWKSEDAKSIDELNSLLGAKTSK